MNRLFLGIYTTVVLGALVSTPTAFASKRLLEEVSGGTDEPNPKRVCSPLEMRKAEPYEDLSVFEDTGRCNEYKEAQRYKMDSPFGVYLATERESGARVGICSFSPHEKDGVFYAEPVIDVLEAHQGKGYGTRLLRHATQKVAGSFGETLDCTQHGAPKSVSLLPMTEILSSTEWEFGSNHAALKMHLNAEYGIVGLGCSSGLLTYTVYPATHPAVWGAEKQETFVRISRAIVLDEEKDSTHNEGSEPGVLNDFHAFLKMLDLSQETEILTLAIFKINAFKIDPDAERAILDFLNTVDEKSKEYFELLAKGDRLPPETQRFSLNRFSGWSWNAYIFETLLQQEQDPD
ncbi:MAG: GNAT family N-acetyltransferase [Candidatus Nucleicultricaceae bacterium]